MKPAPRAEDFRLITGTGRFTDDVAPRDAAFGVFLRASEAHANILEIGTADAMLVPGAIGVLTAADLAAEGIGGIAAPVRIRDAAGAGPYPADWPVLASDRVRYVGQPILLCIADTLTAAHDMAERVVLSTESLPAVIDVALGLKPGAEQLWPDAPGNLAFRWSIGDAAATAAGFANASRIVDAELVNQRICGVPMEPRAMIATYLPETGEYDCQVGSQGVTVLRDALALMVNVAPGKVIVRHGDVGGAFGLKSSPYPEYTALMVAARRFGRAVRWTETRSEAFTADHQSRDTRMRGRLALDDKARILALDIHVQADMGAYLQANGYFISTHNFGMCLPGPYLLPALHASVDCGFTNTVPIGAYRGAGRPEAAWIVELLMDRAAQAFGLDRTAIRKRNLLKPSDLPHRTQVGTTYDTADFRKLLDRAVEASDWRAIATRKRTAARVGRLRGIGMAMFVEIAGSQQPERARIVLEANGHVTLKLALGASGQGHETVFGRVLAERLDIPAETVSVARGDSRGLVDGGGAFGSRGTAAGTTVILTAADIFIEKGRARAADRFEADPQDIEYDRGAFAVRGTGLRVTFAELASDPEPLAVDETATTGPTFPAGCHIAEVEIEQDTGAVRIVRYVAVDDCGRVLSQTLAEGQLHGGIAQGAGQALMEHHVYDAVDGQLQTGSFMDYAIPRAGDLLNFDTTLSPSLTGTNTLGVKGIGEAGTTGALAAIHSAVLDALKAMGVDRFDLPATPARVWDAITAAKSGAQQKAGQRRT
jgi:carbon-monoxide dehydrogenase large subunit